MLDARYIIYIYINGNRNIKNRKMELRKFPHGS